MNATLNVYNAQKRQRKAKQRRNANRRMDRLIEKTMGNDCYSEGFRLWLWEKPHLLPGKQYAISYWNETLNLPLLAEFWPGPSRGETLYSERYFRSPDGSTRRKWLGHISYATWIVCEPENANEESRAVVARLKKRFPDPT